MPSFRSALLVSRHTILSSAHPKEGFRCTGISRTWGADVAPSSLRTQNKAWGTDAICTDKLAVAVNGQRHVSCLVGESTQCRNLELDPRCHKNSAHRGERCCSAVSLVSQDVLERSYCMHAAFTDDSIFLFFVLLEPVCATAAFEILKSQVPGKNQRVYRVCACRRVTRGLVVLCCVGLGLVVLSWVELCWAGFCWVGLVGLDS